MSGWLAPEGIQSSASHVFVDRREAGRQLAERLSQEPAEGIVIGLARGGVEVAAEVARRLRLPLDALAVRKIGHPLQPEYAIGAVTPDGGVYLRPDADVEPDLLEQVVARAVGQSTALERRLLAGRTAATLQGRTCILVDDGLATGSTMIAAIAWARRRGSARVVVAVPVGAPSSVRRLEPLADEVVCLEAPEQLSSVGEWYSEFGQVSDQRVIELLAGATRAFSATDLVIEVAGLRLPVDLTVPDHALGVVIFAHGSGSSRHSPRNRHVAGRLNDAGLGTLLFDLLTPDEALNRAHVFDIPLLADRLAAATAWVRRQPSIAALPVGCFGASTGAAAALWAAAGIDDVSAIVSRGGRPDLAGPKLSAVRAPTLLIVGGADQDVLELNRQAQAQMRCKTELRVIPGATHLFEEPGTLEQVADLAAEWFADHMAGHVGAG